MFSIETEDIGEEISNTRSAAENASAILRYFRECGWITSREVGRSGDNIAAVTSACRKLVEGLHRLFDRERNGAITNHIFAIYGILKDALGEERGRTIRPYSNLLVPLIEQECDLKNELFELRDNIRDIMRIVMQISDANSFGQFLVKDQVLDEFYEVCLAQQYIAEGGIAYAKDLLEKSLGAERAKDVIGKLTASLQVRPFEFVRKTDASQLLNFIQDEHPQTIALILSYLPSSQASAIISALTPDKQTDVAKRIAQMDRTSPEVIKEVEKVLEQKLASLVNQDYTIVGGVDSIVEILNTVDRGTEKHIMESLEIEDPELADEIRKKMFVFEDILSLDDRSVQRVLREVDNNELAVALKGSNEEVQNLIFSNLSSRLATMIREDMDFMGPVRMKDVEEAQQKIVNIIRKLEDSAEIIISRGGGDEIVV